MIYLKNNFKTFGIVASALLVLSCNKGAFDAEVIPQTAPSGLSLAATLAASPTDSLFSRMVIKSGMAATLGNNALAYTLFVPNNAAVIASFGGTLASANATIGALPAGSLASIVRYHTIPQKLTSFQIVHGFPNLQMPTDFVLVPSNPFIRLTAFPSKNPSTSLFYYNNVPLTAPDAVVGRSVIHRIAFVAAPPQRVLKDTIGRVTNLSYFRAAVARADSGQVDLNRLDSLLNYAVTNMTVLAPNDAAFQTLIFGLVYGQTLAATGDPVIANTQATGAVALGPAIFQVPSFFAALPAITVRGIIAYHLLASPGAGGAIQPNIRAFSVNIPSTPTLVKTLVNASVAAHPGVRAQATFTGPFATTVTFTGLGTFPPGGAPFSGAPATVVAADQHAVNGVFHVIDKVLLPQ